LTNFNLAKPNNHVKIIYAKIRARQSGLTSTVRSLFESYKSENLRERALSWAKVAPWCQKCFLTGMDGGRQGNAFSRAF